jgi:excisionase family DNA binding protein
MACIEGKDKPNSCLEKQAVKGVVMSEPSFQLVRPLEAAKILGISKSTLYAWLADGTINFRPIRLGARATAFRFDELQEWLNSRSRTVAAGT